VCLRYFTSGGNSSRMKCVVCCMSLLFIDPWKTDFFNTASSLIPVSDPSELRRGVLCSRDQIIERNVFYFSTRPWLSYWFSACTLLKVPYSNRKSSHYSFTNQSMTSLSGDKKVRQNFHSHRFIGTSSKRKWADRYTIYTAQTTHLH